MKDILCMVTDGEINTPADAAAILGEETAEYRAQLLQAINSAADRIFTPRTSDHLRRLFKLEYRARTGADRPRTES